MWEIFLALAAGLLTIAAPCILLPLPILLGTSIGQTAKSRPVFIALGFTATFAILGLLLNFFVQSFRFDPNILRRGAAVILAVFGIFMVLPGFFERLMSRASGLIGWADRASHTLSRGKWGGLLLGVIIGIVWAPCAGPVLGAILTLVAQESDLGRAAVLMVFYAIGAGLPMLVIAYGGQALTTRLRHLARYSTRLQQIFGVIIIGLAAAIFWQYDTYLQARLLDLWPSLNSNF